MAFVLGVAAIHVLSCLPSIAADVLITLNSTAPSPRDIVIRKGDRIVWQLGYPTGGPKYRVRDLEGAFASHVVDDLNPSFSHVYASPGVYGYSADSLDPRPPYPVFNPNLRAYGVVEVLGEGSETNPVILNYPNPPVPLLTGKSSPDSYVSLYMPLQASPLRTNGIRRVEFALEETVVARTTNWPYRAYYNLATPGAFNLIATAIYEDGSSVSSLPRRIEVEVTDDFFTGHFGIPVRVREGFYLMNFQHPPSGARWSVRCPPLIPIRANTNAYPRYLLVGQNCKSGRLPVLSVGVAEFMYFEDEF